MRAFTEVTKFNQDGSGLAISDFSITTLWPFFKIVFGGLNSPSTLPDEYLLPKSVCIVYAKSI